MTTPTNEPYLELCDVCNQMTNYKDGKCLKHTNEPRHHTAKVVKSGKAEPDTSIDADIEIDPDDEPMTVDSILAPLHHSGRNGFCTKIPCKKCEQYDEATTQINALIAEKALFKQLEQLRLLDEVRSIGQSELDNTMYHLMVEGIRDWCKLTGKTVTELEQLLQKGEE